MSKLNPNMPNVHVQVGSNLYNQSPHFIYVLAIDQFISSCRKLIENGPEHIGLMEEAHEEAIKLSETIQSLGTGLYYDVQTRYMSFNHLVDGLKTKKAVKVHENHAWNCRLLRGQIEQLKNAISESIRQLTQVVEGAIQYNLIQVSVLFNSRSNRA